MDQRATHRRRSKVAPGQRKRVATACHSCSLRRVKCSGEQPCRRCAKASRQCVYPAEADSVSIPRAELDELRARVAQLDAAAACHGPRDSTLSDVDNSGGAEASPVDSDEVATPQGRLLHDPDGTARFLGQSSGANFLNCVKEFMATVLPLATNFSSGSGGGHEAPGRTFLTSVGRYQTFDSRPLQLPPVDPFWLPSRTERTVMLAEFCYFLQDGNQDFPSGGITYWGDLAGLLSGPDSPDNRGLALLHIVFAVAAQLGSNVHGNSDAHHSEAYLARARAIVGNPLDITTYTPHHVSVLSLMALYLVEMNRRDSAYVAVSTALHLAIMYGLHSGYSPDEGTKRAFWTLYTLDRWLSSLLGRPPSIVDAAIRLELPQDVPGFPPAAGLRAHVELARISGYIVYNVYRIAPWDHSTNTTVQHVDQGLQRLRDWSSSLPAILQVDYEQLGTDRACCGLHLAYNQVVILTTRPIFFVAVRKSVADRYLPSPTRSGGTHGQLHETIVRQCIEAARQNLRLGDWIRSLSPRQKLLHQEAHAVFNAAIIVLLHQLAFPDVHAGDVAGVAFAMAVFEREAELGNNFGVDCARVLHDLDYLVQRMRSNLPAEGEPSSLESRDPVPDAQGGLVNTSINLESSVRDHGAVYQELETWLDNDFLQLYNDYLL
ncbi:hypothetical protein CONLIGDRAFT_582244 [Coniochaeta ligniaria NRRL 30616]|uniref:Zn(2)-C6 fungal-type domain-containing protein n=1 Tax=Coniochaeta ligniaria NRRL 30616 TaxID=1408157 RepID=A0A1J7IFI8_9PEZI|nr:hypothetical protein CONLIGDRAFT_582244 [Coniochaeta ligniaria NRRL 30616]